MEAYLLVIAFFVATLLHFGVQKLFIHYKRFDDFNYRSSHKTLATRTGGIGIYLTILFISLFFYFQGIEIFDYSLFIPLSIMFVIGVYDDLYNADFKLKFLLQIIVAKILIDQGYIISNYHGLFGLYDVTWLLAQASTIFVFLVIINAINFIDGIDGLAIPEIIKIITVLEFFSNGLTNLAPLGLLIISSLLPLYYFNFKKKRKVFLGDGGSLLLGTVVSIYIFNILGENFHFINEIVINKVFFSVFVLLYPLIDLLRVFFLRIKNGVSPFKPDNNHFHHYLLKKTNNQFYTLGIIAMFDLTCLCILIFYLQ